MLNRVSYKLYKLFINDIIIKARFLDIIVDITPLRERNFIINLIQRALILRNYIIRNSINQNVLNYIFKFDNYLLLRINLNIPQIAKFAQN